MSEEQQPAATPPEAETAKDVPARGKAHPSPPGRKVLVVDDNITWAQSLALLLSLEGHEAQVVHDGTTALEALKNYQHEVVLMDIGLPGIDGYEVARRIRREVPHAGPLLVAITGYAEDSARRSSREAGFDHHLVKPVDPETILALLASLEWSEQGRRNPSSRDGSSMSRAVHR